VDNSFFDAFERLIHSAQQTDRIAAIVVLLLSGARRGAMKVGRMRDPAASKGPEEHRADGIEGGVTHNLKKGEIIVVPAMTPHVPNIQK
jgi:hypothetical protein